MQVAYQLTSGMVFFEEADQFEKVGKEDGDERQDDGDFVLTPPAVVGLGFGRTLYDLAGLRTHSSKSASRNGNVFFQRYDQDFDSDWIVIGPHQVEQRVLGLSGFSIVFLLFSPPTRTTA